MFPRFLSLQLLPHTKQESEEHSTGLWSSSQFTLYFALKTWHFQKLMYVHSSTRLMWSSFLWNHYFSGLQWCYISVSACPWKSHIISVTFDDFWIAWAYEEKENIIAFLYTEIEEIILFTINSMDIEFYITDTLQSFFLSWKIYCDLTIAI